MKRWLLSCLAMPVLFLALTIHAQAGSIESEWIPESALPEGAEIVDEKWVLDETTYQKKLGDPEIAGFEIYKTDWVPQGTIVTYYASVPNGFDTSHPLYQRYKLNQGGAQIPYTTESEKLEVSNGFETYIYWHWMYDCGGANGHAKRAILDFNGWGPDTGYLYKYFSAFPSTNGNYACDRYYCNGRNIKNYIVPEKTSYGETRGATRWFRFEVHRSTATKFSKMYFGKSCSSRDIYNRSMIPNYVDLEKHSGTYYTDPNEDENNRIDWKIERWVRYEVEVEDVVAPYANFTSGSQLKPGDTITLSCADPDATILYTVSENVVNPDPADVYTGPFQVLDKENFTVTARAVREGMGDSETVFYTYHIGNLQGFPTVTTLDASQITETSALLSCSVESGSRVLQTQFAYYEKGDNMRQYIAQADSHGNFLLENLMPGTEYWFQARATNLSGFSSGNVCSFRTAGKVGRAPSMISLNPSYAVITPGGTRTLLATVLPVMAKKDVYWSSEDETVATVDENGKVTATGIGITRILATTVLGRKQAACTVEVFSQPDLTGEYDFSEYNMLMSCSASNTDGGYDFSAFRGGNSQMATAYLARWGGAVAERNDPYPSQPIDSYTRLESDFHVQEVLYLPWRSDSMDNDEIKSAVMNYGAVYAPLRTGPEFRNNGDRDFYLPEGRRGSKGHTMAVVGWDDQYSASNFSVTPPGNGAFICKNSWGAQSGENGYCYVSYYDSTFAMEKSDDIPAVFYFMQTSDNYNKIYQYDELGAVDVYKDFGGDSGWYANVFPREGETLPADESLEAVSFYTISPGTSYALYIVTNYQGVNSLCQLGEPVKSGSIDYAGYHTITMSEPVRLAAGTRFAVVFRITDQTGNASVFIEAPRIGISSNARGGAGESFVRGSNGQWMDLTTVSENANVCLKAFTKTDFEETALLEEISPLYHAPADYTEAELAEMSTGLNPAFLAALSGAEDSDDDGQATGLVPPSILPNLSSSFHYAEGAQFPSHYDLREEGFVTPVRSQGGLPACWTFATYASLESCVLRAATSGYSLVGGLNQAGDEDIYILLSAGDSAVNLLPGGTAQLFTTIYPFDSDVVLFWESSDPSVAAVSPRGTITAKEAGTAEITVRTEDNSASASCTVQVSEEEPPQSLVISSPKAVLQSGRTALLNCYTYPTPVDASELIWESENPAVATVDAYGLLTAVGRGTARIRATTPDGAASGNCTVSVDNGGEVFSVILSDGLVQHDGLISGELSVLVHNRGNARQMTLVLAFYTAEGQFLHSVTRDCTLEPGNNTIRFSDLEFSGGAGLTFRTFSLSGDGSMIPLDCSLSGTVLDTD